MVSSENHLVPGIVIGAATSLAQLRDILLGVIPELPVERMKVCHALLKHLRTLAGEQIRNLAVGFSHCHFPQEMAYLTHLVFPPLQILYLPLE